MATIAPKTGLLGAAAAAHLLRRATFTPTKARINEFANYSVDTAVNMLFEQPTNLAAEPLAYDTNQIFIPNYNNPTVTPSIMDASERARSIYNWQIFNSRIDESAYSKIFYFIHSIFIATGPGIPEWTYDYFKLINYYTSRSIKDFAKKISRLSEMLHYLDNRYNTVNSPNENYAREFLELFTIKKGPQDGVGSYTNYTEQDVQLAAKILTGFTVVGVANRMNYIDTETNLVTGMKIFNNHDTSNKTFSAKFYNQTITGATNAAGMDVELDTFINMVFNQMATAKSFARRLYRFYVRRTISAEVESDIITPLASNLMNTNYDLPSTIKMLLKSVHFYDEDSAIVSDEIIGAKIKSPLELSLIMINQFKISLPSHSTNILSNFHYSFRLRTEIDKMGFPLFNAINVNGYPAYSEDEHDKLWLSISTLNNRYNMQINNFINGFNHNGFLIRFDTVDYVRNGNVVSNPLNANTLIDEILTLCFVELPTGDRYNFFRQQLLGNLSVINWQFEWQNYITTNNSTAVRTALNRFFVAIVKSREYQIF